MAKKMSMLEKLKKEQERLAESKGGNYEQVDWYKPSIGDNVIRVLPNIHDEDDVPYHTIRLHYINVKKKDGTVAKGVPVRCYTELGDDNCPICAYASKLFKSGDEESLEKGKRYASKEVHLYNVIDYKNKVAVPYAAGKQVHDAIVGNLVEYQEADTNVLSVEEGKNFKIIKKEKKPGSKAQFNIEYAVRIDPKASAVPPKLLALAEDLPELDTYYQSKEEAIVKAFLGYESDEEFEEDEDEAPKKSAKKRYEDDEEEEKPTKKFGKRPSRDEEEDEDEAPKKVKKKVVEDDEDERPTSKFKMKKKVVEEEEEDERPVKKASSKKAVVKDDDIDLDMDFDDVDAELESIGM